MSSSKGANQLLREIQQLLAEEELSRRASDIRHSTMKEKFLQFRALVNLDLAEDETKGSEVVTVTRSDHVHDEASQSEAPNEWMTLAEAGRLARVHRGTILRATNAGIIKGNGKRGHKRRVEKSSVLFWMGRQQAMSREKGYAEYEKVLNGISD